MIPVARQIFAWIWKPWPNRTWERYAAIAPGNLADSEVWQRINSDDDSEVMPPADSHRKPLTAAEKATIRQWIIDGAPWGKHWSLERIERPSIPAAADDSARHPIDAFIRKRLADQGLQPAPPAALHTQRRRLAFALTGMSPSPGELRQFVAKPSAAAWQTAIDRTLASSHYAERMAMWWLDAARYSDSDGFQIDATRENWPWRDWVIDAFAQNMPFDRFTVEQFAGDLLPNSTDEQILATCFHRNHMTNGEGGRDPEESRMDYVIDRVNTIGTVWLGLTLGCTQCHAHKFDPISQQDYYSLSAFFNSIDENGKAGKGATPYLKYSSPRVETSISALDAFVAACQRQEDEERVAAEKRFLQWLAELQNSPSQTYRPWWTPEPVRMESAEGTNFVVEPDRTIQTTGPDVMHDDYRIELPLAATASRVTGWRLEVFPHNSHTKGMFTRFGNGDFTLTGVKLLGKRADSPIEMDLPLVGAVADYEAEKERKSVWDRRYANIRETLNDDARDGWTTEGAEQIQPHVGVFELETPWLVEPNDRLIVVLQHRSTHGHANIGRFRVSLTTELGETVRRADGGAPLQDWYASSDRQNALETLRPRLLAQFLLGDDAYQAVHSRLERARRQLRALQEQTKPRSVMVLKEREQRRPTHVLVRGVWDAKGETVEPGALPAVLDWPAENLQTRLDLAHWLVDRENPLTARVIVNHLWQIMFGVGLVRTPADFGLQGELPTHPDLLDWLAVELMENDWDVQHILRLIASSETFRQSSTVTTKLLAVDPDNRFFARAPKYRLPAWMLRDNALKVSGLLNPQIGGPPVFPDQPPGVWSDITMGRFHYEPSLGPAQYRRTIYAFWRRSSAPAFLFDSAQRRVCEVRVRNTNTPLHALTLMNNQTQLEAARALADAVANDASFEDGTQALAERVLGRELNADDLDSVQQVYRATREHFDSRTAAAQAYLHVGQRSTVNAADASRRAAWMTVASLLLNLDEAISYE